MINFFPAELYCLLGHLDYSKDLKPLHIWSDPTLWHHDPDRREREIKLLIRSIDLLNEYIKPLELIVSCDRSQELRNYLVKYIKPKADDNWLVHANYNSSSPFSPEIISSQIEGLLKSIDEGLRKKKFTYIPDKKTSYYERDDLFGPEVNAAFPSAASHIKEAGNCLAADLNTAAAFHLMLVAEIGLRALARRLKVKLKHDLEYEEWGKVISAIKIELDKTSPRSKKGQRKVEFYRKAMDECDYLRDVWRNNVFHGRKPCDEFDANKAFTKVKDFMQRLAKRVHLK